jgi:hypothetical protein
MARGSIVGNEQQNTSVLNLVHEGMDVYDREDKKVGTVERLFFGSASTMDAGNYEAQTQTVDQELDYGHDSIVDVIAEAFDPADDIPEVLRNRLLQQGFIRIDGAGLFASDRYVVPDQIARVSDDKVYLKVSQDNLIKR